MPEGIRLSGTLGTAALEIQSPGPQKGRPQQGDFFWTLPILNRPLHL
jgi:hypothetical protein